MTRLAAWAPLAPEDDDSWDEPALERLAADVEAVSKPLSIAERDALLPLLSYPEEDTIYGVLWGVVHLVESAPMDDVELTLPVDGGTWLTRLRIRRENLDRWSSESDRP